MRVAVFRALMLGDLLCATPALRALRHGWPDAQITLVGLPWARALAERLASVDSFIEFPGWPGLPERRRECGTTLRAWLAAMRSRRFDMALQLHGSGECVNGLVAAFGAKRCAAFVPGAVRDTAHHAMHRTVHDPVPWPAQGSEVERLLALTDRLALPRQGTGLDFPLRDGDRDAAERLCRPLGGRRFVLLHPGSQLPSRRWPAERFAAVGDALAAEGLAVVLTGSAGEAPLTRAVAERMRAPCLDLAGCTDLWTLGALVEWAAAVVCNDTGISHIAAALGTPSVVVASGSDVPRWAPADSERNRVFWRDLPCRPCAHVHCPHDQACARAVDADDVAQAALAHLGRPQWHEHGHLQRVVVQRPAPRHPPHETLSEARSA